MEIGWNLVKSVRKIGGKRKEGTGLVELEGRGKCYHGQTEVERSVPRLMLHMELRRRKGPTWNEYFKWNLNMRTNWTNGLLEWHGILGEKLVNPSHKSCFRETCITKWWLYCFQLIPWKSISFLMIKASKQNPFRRLKPFIIQWPLKELLKTFFISKNRHPTLHWAFIPLWKYWSGSSQRKIVCFWRPHQSPPWPQDPSNHTHV